MFEISFLKNYQRKFIRKLKTLTTKKNSFEFSEINFIKVIKFLVKNLSKENVLERKTFWIKRPLRWSL